MQGLHYKYRVAVIAVLALFVDLIDLTVVNVALPTLQREFDATTGQVQWTVTAYVLALGVVMPLSGWAADRFGTKRTFLVAAAAFTAASALGAAAWSLESLVAFRALQGVGGGLLVPVGMAMLFRAFPEEERGRASAIFSTPAALAPALGPLLGGVLVDELSWRWVFFVNLPIGALALLLGARLLREHVEPDAGTFDAPGFFLGGAAVVALVLGLSLIPSQTLPAGALGTLLIAGTLLLCLFVRVELRRARPMVDLRLFRRRDFTAGNAVMALAATGFGGTLVVLPLLLQAERGLSALAAGTIIAAHAVGIMVSTPVAAWLVERGGARRVLAAAMAGTALVTATLAIVDLDTPLELIGSVLFAAGLFFGLAVVPLQTVPFAGMAESEMARGTAILNVVRQIGLALGTALLATVLSAGLDGVGDDDRIAAYQTAFLVAAAVAAVGAAAVALLHRHAPTRPT